MAHSLPHYCDQQARIEFGEEDLKDVRIHKQDYVLVNRGTYDDFEMLRQDVHQIAQHFTLEAERKAKEAKQETSGRRVLDALIKIAALIFTVTAMAFAIKQFGEQQSADKNAHTDSLNSGTINFFALCLQALAFDPLAGMSLASKSEQPWSNASPKNRTAFFQSNPQLNRTIADFDYKFKSSCVDVFSRQPDFDLLTLYFVPERTPFSLHPDSGNNKAYLIIVIPLVIIVIAIGLKIISAVFEDSIQKWLDSKPNNEGKGK